MATSYRISDWRAWLFPWVSFAYLLLIFGVPTGGSLLLLRSSGSLRLWTALAVPLVWVFGFLIVAGLLSLPHQFAVVPGKFRRDVSDRTYFHRRLYGLCWTAVYYNKPAYFICLSVPFLKWAIFRLFGYHGSMNFTVYPDTWIRDLPLLHFEDGVYLSNRASLGTNIVLSNGFLLVGKITLHSKAIVGHFAGIGPGVELGSGVEVGIGAIIGIRTKIGSDSLVGPRCAIEHGVQIGRNTALGPNTYVGSRSTIPDGMKLPGGSVVAPRTQFAPQVDEKIHAECFE